MLLLIDAGNTRVKWALVSPEAPLAAWEDAGSVAHAAWPGMAHHWRGRRITRALACNVAGEGMRAAIAAEVAGAGAAVEWFASGAQAGGLRNGYREPAQLGADRFAACIGAAALYPGESLIVATCGTATTVDAVRGDGVFLGGLILPGLGLMAASLAHGTAQLPQVDATARALQPFADNTRDAIVSGCLAAQAGAIERAFAAMQETHGAARCILSGGAAASVGPHLRVPHAQVEWLVLIGLQRLARDSGARHAFSSAG